MKAIDGYVGYIRVSTQEQSYQKSLENQKARLREVGAKEIFEDVESGTSPTREGFNRLLQRISEGKVLRVIATDLDRLSRDPIMHGMLKQILQSSQTELVLLNRGKKSVDFDNPAEGFLHNIDTALAAFEVAKTRQRIKKARQEQRNRQAPGGQPPWGYVVEDEKYQLDRRRLSFCQLEHRPANHLELAQLPDQSAQDPDESERFFWLDPAQIAREVFEVFFDKRKPTKVLKYLHENYGLEKKHILRSPEMKGLSSPEMKDLLSSELQDSRLSEVKDLRLLELRDFPLSDTGFKRWLQNPVFQGHTSYLQRDSSRRVKPREEWEICHDTHRDQRLISDQEAEEVEKILASNRKRFGQTDATFYLTSLIYCHECGSKCTLRKGGGRHYYGCRYSSTTCQSSGMVPIAVIEQAIIYELAKRARDISEGSQSAGKSQKLIELEQQYQQLIAIPGADSNEALKQAKRELEKEIEAEQRDTESYGSQMLRIPEAKKINFWYTLTKAERETFYELLVAQVKIANKEVTSVTLKV